MRQLIRSAQSERDLIGIWQHIAADSESAATKFVERIERRIQSLAKYPYIYR